VELLVNDLSVAGQFPDIPAFQDAIGQVMEMRKMAQRYGCSIFCHRNLQDAQVTKDLKMQQAVGFLEIDKRRGFNLWITKHGPFWDDERALSPDEYMEVSDLVVTETAIGEAAYCRHQGIDRQLISLTPSAWQYNPIPVRWTLDDASTRDIDVPNHWEAHALEAALLAAPTPITSWAQMIEACNNRCPFLTFSEDCYEALVGLPFVKSSVDQIVMRLDMLNRVKQGFDDYGHRTAEAQQLLDDHFGSKGQRFSPSSEKEMGEFANELIFKHPDRPGEYLSCPWHGKFRSPSGPIRIHFSWPILADQPLYIVHIGRKITKR
jgi:hypothetical protein